MSFLLRPFDSLLDSSLVVHFGFRELLKSFQEFVIPSRYGLRVFLLHDGGLNEVSCHQSVLFR